MNLPQGCLDVRGVLFALACVCGGPASAQEPLTEAAVTHILEVEQDVNLHIVDWGGEGLWPNDVE